MQKTAFAQAGWPVIKPRIKRAYSVPLGRAVWFCTSAWVVGLADTPLAAYRDWQAHMQLRGLMPYQKPQAGITVDCGLQYIKKGMGR